MTFMLAMVALVFGVMPFMFGMMPTLVVAIMVMSLVVTIVVALLVMTIVSVVIPVPSMITAVIIQSINDQISHRSTSQHFNDVVSVMVCAGRQRCH
jgi:hypothetical protein